MKTITPLSVPAARGRGNSAGADRAPPPAAAPAPSGPAAKLRLNSKERLAVLEQFATLVDSGIQIAPALQGMRQQTIDPRHAAVLASLEQGVVAGMTLSAAMAGMPRAFPPLLVQLVRAGEATGQLGDMLRRTVEALEIEASMRSKLRSAMIYPAIMATLTVAVVVFLLTYIVPRFERLLRGKQLPRPTRILLATGDFMRDHGVTLLAFVGVSIAGAVVLLRTPRGKRWLDRVMLATPGVGKLHRTAVLARCTRTFGLLLTAGVPVHGALEYTQEVAGSPTYRDFWQRARNIVIGGGTLIDGVRGQRLLGANFEQLVAAGEATATLDRVMRKTAEQFTKELERRIRDLLTIIEPVMVVVMAGVVGFVAMSIMLPIFQMSRV